MNQNDRREAKRIQKEQEAREIDAIKKEMKALLASMPNEWSNWDIVKTQDYKAFYQKATSKLGLIRPKIEDIRRIKIEALEWYKP